MLTKLSIKNVSIVFLLTALVLFAGAYTIPRLGIEFLPEIAPPVVSVITVYPNASPDSVAHDVTKPVEEAVGTVSGLDSMNSVSNENISIVIANFSYGIDMDQVEAKVTQEINKIKGDLPDGTMEPKIMRYNMSDSPIMSLSVISKGGQVETSRIVKDIIKPEIEKVQGVASVEIGGLAEKRYEVVLDPAKLKDHKLSSTQVVQILKANNLTIPGGTMDIGTKSIPIQTISRLKTRADLENMVVSVGIDEEKAKDLQSDALKGALKGAFAAQQKGLKKAFEMQSKAIMKNIQGTLQNQMKGGLPGGKLPSGYPSGQIPGGYPPAGGGTTPTTSPQGGQTSSGSTTDSTSTHKQSSVLQGDSVKYESYRLDGYGAKAKAIPVASNSAISYSSMGSFSGASSSGGSSDDLPLKIVYLKDVAAVNEAYDPGASIYRTNKQPSIGIQVKKGSKQNTVAVADAILAKIPDLERRAGDGTKIMVASNQADYIKNALNGMIREGLLGAFFAVLVIFFFLRNLRSTLVAAISIPLSVVIGLVFLYLAGISLNIFTLGGITIAIGRVVDDSIVVLENIFRHMQATREKRINTVIKGTGEVARAITASTITTVAVFLPLGFVQGFIGELFRPFAYTVTLTLLASLLVAVTIVPILAAKFMSKKNIGHSNENSRLKNIYMGLLRWSLKRKVFVIAVSTLLFVGSLMLSPFIPKNFISSPNQGSFNVSIEMPVGTSLGETSKVAAKVEDVLSKDNRIKSFRSLIGSAQGSYASGGGSDAGTVIATVKDSYKDNKNDIIKEVRAKIEHIDPVAKLAVSGAESLAGMGNTIEVNITANSYEDLKSASATLMDDFAKIKDIANIKSNLSQSKPELRVEVNEITAMKKGLTAIQVAGIVRGAVNGDVATTLESEGLSTDVFVRLDKAKVKDRDSLAALPIVAPIGGTIRLDSIAKVSLANGPVNITRINQERSATLTMEPVTKNTGAASRAVQDAVKKANLPDGASASVEGISSMMDKGFSSMGMALLVAILLVYMVMVATFKSLLHPVTMMFSLPLAVIGAVVALFATGRELGMPSLIGVLMLVGIVVTNAIVLLDLVQQLRARGASAFEAIIQAGSTRMRPILMTALATILALIPMAVGRTEGGIISAPLATVVIGGLLTSTFLTLVVIPVLYMTFDALRERFGIEDSSFETTKLAQNME